MNGQAKRLFTEQENWNKAPLPNVALIPLRDNLTQWEAVFDGPESTPYEGGKFHLSIDIPKAYPFKPPKVAFKTKIFHPNIYNDGRICLDILNSDKWSPVFSLAQVVQSIQSLLNDPNAASPANGEAGRLYEQDPAAYETKVREFVKRHAL
jgi:ubiquitin-conjugating enzyme E2 A